MSFKELKERNKWKNATIALSLFCFILIIGIIIKGTGEINGWRDNMCDKISGIPSWVDYKGNILTSGYQQIISSSIPNETTKELYYASLKEILTKSLIDERISFVYREGCGWCEKQIDEFKILGFWNDYKNSGLTINCTR